MMKELNEAQQQAKLDAQDYYFDAFPQRDSTNSRQAFTAGFVAGLEWTTEPVYHDLLVAYEAIQEALIRLKVALAHVSGGEQ